MSTVKRSVLLPVFAMLALVSLVLVPPSLAVPRYLEVTLTYVEGGSPCITVSPDPATINWDKRPRKVRWVSVGSSDLIWQIEWRKDKAKDQPDYFGKKYKIDKGKKEKKSDKPSRHDWTGTGARWPYMVSVHSSTASGEPDQLLCELGSAHTRHDDVGDQQVEPLVL